ncbi:MAG: ATP-binding protein [Clostridiales bacterium]|nr:ATP-binding protein [Clostridiales bacterium]
MKKQQSVFKVYSCFAEGMKGVISEIEVSVSPGLPTFDIIGLCDSSIRESRGRIRSALVSSGFFLPKGHITVSISPAYMRKSGSAFDLPVALGIIFVSGQLPIEEGKKVYAEGELSLKGEIKGTPGAALRLMSIGGDIDYMIIPGDEKMSAGCAGIKAHTVDTLDDVGKVFIEGDYSPQSFDDEMKIYDDEFIDISVLKGQEKASRAVRIAACGMHNILMLGSPGCGKTIAGKILAGIMPQLSPKEASQVFAINETAGLFDEKKGITRPFRYIYPGISRSQLMGSSGSLFPGEIAMADNGILFADEITEFPAGILDILRLPLEERIVRIQKEGNTYTYPASFIFVGAGNPCKCGMLYEKGSRCVCSPNTVKRYQSKLAGPFMDRIDIVTEMRSIEAKDLEETSKKTEGLLTPAVKEKVKEIWEIQKERYGSDRIFNGTVSVADADLLRAGKDVVEYASDAAIRGGMSARGYSKLLRVGRTIADIEGRSDMTRNDIAEAYVYKRRI